MAASHTPTGRRLLRCDRCGRADEATHAVLMRHTRDGWPKCCGQTMASFAESERPVDPGTRFSHKCPVCGNEWAVTFPPGVPVPDRTDLPCL